MSARVTEGLKPCPFCGGEAVVHSREFTDDKADLGNAYIECADCHIETAYYRTEAEAIAAWNCRHREQATAELVDALRDLESYLRDTPHHNAIEAAAARKVLSRHTEPTDADLLDQVCRGMEEVSKPLTTVFSDAPENAGARATEPSERGQP